MSILKIENLKKIYSSKDGEDFIAVDGVDIEVNKGECVGLVGESGCGKTTISKMVTGLQKPSGGSILINNQDITKYSNKEIKRLYKDVQMIFQNPMDSFNPKNKLGNSIGEIKINFGENKRKVKEDILKLLETVGLKEDYYHRYPSEVSGGECQRAAIARALAINPQLIICDEPTSALDVSVQAQIINLLKKLQKEENLSYLFISHDLALVQNICQRIYVMYRGNIVECGTRDDIIDNPKHPYTKLLLSSILSVDDIEMLSLDEDDELLIEETNTKGCKFYNRCNYRKDICKNDKPQLTQVSNNHKVACNLI